MLVIPKGSALVIQYAGNTKRFSAGNTRAGAVLVIPERFSTGNTGERMLVLMVLVSP
jgi:hypothetical protein